MASKDMDAIQLLTQDHREVEALFQKFEELGERAKVGKKKLADQICMALIVHSQIEEEIFYPAVRGSGKEMEDLVEEAVVEHASAKDLIDQIQSMDVDEELYDAKLKVLSEQIQHHIGEEEKEMMPKVRKLKQLDLLDLGRQMSERKTECMQSLQAGRFGAKPAATERRPLH